MNDDKNQEYLNDMIVIGMMSNCCSARIYEPDICKACKEHCEAIKEDEDKENETFDEHLDSINKD